ncbi:MAG: capsular polysaccharide biosynthesis protein, partial [Bacteroidia bacterium]
MSAQENFIDFTFSDILSFILRWRKHLIIIGLIAAVVTAASTYLITPKYEAEVVFYPTTVNSIGNAMFTDLNKRESDVLAFGEEEEAENALQILKSDKLSIRIIQQFDLMSHYDIDPNGSFPRTKLQEEMKKNISYNRTRYLSISIKVLDEDPEMAATIANGIGAMYDSVKTAIQRDVAREAFAIVDEEYQNKVKEVWDLKVGLQRLGEKGILDIEKQAQSITESLYGMKASNSSSQA